MTKVKIEYGILSGKLSGARLERALRSAGYELVDDALQAEVILAHSAGCFWLPEAPSGKKLVLIDPPYWPDKSIRERARSQRRANLQFRQFGYSFFPWFRRNLWGLYYVVRDIRRSLRIVRYAREFNLENTIRTHDHILLVRNHSDTWLTPEYARLKQLNHTLETVELPGSHEDLTHHPERYVELLQSHL